MSTTSHAKFSRREILHGGIALSASCCLADMAMAAPTESNPYVGAVPAEQMAWLRSAENPYGPPESARRAVAAGMDEGNMYPRSKVDEFKKLIADDLGLTPEHVIVGAGSIELMLCAGLYYGKLGKQVISADPTWTTTAEYAEANGAKWKKLPLAASLHHDFEGMLAAVTDDVSLVYLCHPNNPTGKAESPAALERFVKAVAEQTHIMVDEALSNASKMLKLVA